MGNTPNIRFKGFTDDWEQRKVSEITTSYSGGTPKAGKAEYYDGDIPFIRSGEIYDKYTELFITQEGMNNSSAKMVSKGDILYALYGATSGEVSRAGLDGAINQAILAILPEEGIDADFLVEWFRNEKANIIDKYLQGGQGNLSAQIIKNLDILIPSFEEQQKMGQYFSELNNLITLHQRKCDETKELKKFMLQKMFPKNGEKKPEIRFEGFTDDWEQRKLGEIANKVTTKNKDTQYVETFTNSAELGIISQRDFFDHDVSNIDNISGYYVVDDDAFVYNPRISTSAPVGPINRNKLGRTGVMSPLYTVFKTHNVDSEYLEWFFKSTKWHSFMKFNGDSGARSDRFSIKDTVFFEMPIPIPDIEEQKKIGEYFSNLDNLITLHQRKCDEIKEIKKFMLQNMFPQKG